ncbi:hypothetical protein QZH41_010630 [Actinostola sp. cb2023]|nr:hypothetical protein QZH41_010630 [Actinostola sp. cb2023]
MAMFLLLLVLAVLSSTCGMKSGEYVSVVVSSKDQSLDIVPGKVFPNVAWARFSNEIDKSGWSYLEVHSNGSYPNDKQARAAGMAEGYITSELIHLSWLNQYASYCENETQFCEKLEKFIQENEKWMIQEIASDLDEYWHQVQLIFIQLDGLRDGYRHNKTLPDIPELGFLAFQGAEDFADLEMVLKKKNPRRTKGSGSCSALIKLLPENKELFISHVTWTTYIDLLRIFKLYDFPFQYASGKNQIPGYRQSFSSSPGNLLSGDDFYLLSSGMVSQETTIGNSNADLWKYVTPEGIVFEWIRTMVANRLAKTSGEWTYMFSKFNSGTYNNQWMVLDYKLFVPGQPIKPGTLSILEQIPGMTESADMSIHLDQRRYWASYNIPYFPSIYNTSGFEDIRQKYGAFFDYNLSPRAQIFRRDQHKVVDIDSMMKLMRYNDFKNDPLSKCKCTPPYSAENGISARCDLNPADGKYPIPALGHRMHGGTDCKVHQITSSELFKKFQCHAVSGPTHDQQPVFQWSKTEWKRPLGHPDKFDFSPVVVSWDSEN